MTDSEKDTLNRTADSGRRLDKIDSLIDHFDRALRTLHPGITKARRSNPSADLDESEMSAEERRHAAGLMRVNHTGEVCAQALYSGQSLTARSDDARQAMLESAQEEEDHLAWCEQRLEELDAKTSILNPLFYAGSFAMGALAGLSGDKFSLGFIEATEDRVCQHLRDHLQKLPAADKRSRAIVAKMIEDETIHGEKALQKGGRVFTEAQKNAMAELSKVMTSSTYRI